MKQKRWLSPASDIRMSTVSQSARQPAAARLAVSRLKGPGINMEKPNIDIALFSLSPIILQDNPISKMFFQFQLTR